MSVAGSPNDDADVKPAPSEFDGVQGRDGGSYLDTGVPVLDSASGEKSLGRREERARPGSRTTQNRRLSAICTSNPDDADEFRVQTVVTTENHHGEPNQSNEKGATTAVLDARSGSITPEMEKIRPSQRLPRTRDAWALLTERPAPNLLAESWSTDRRRKCAEYAVSVLTHLKSYTVRDPTAQ